VAATPDCALNGIENAVNSGTCLAAISIVTASDAAKHVLCATTCAGPMQIAKAVKVDPSDLHDGCSTSFANLRLLETNNLRRTSWANIFSLGYSVFPAASCCWSSCSRTSSDKRREYTR
jgi:hypothetical protein